VKDLEFQLLNRRDGISSSEAQCDELGLSAPWGTGLLMPPTEYLVTTFLSSVENPVFSLFNGGTGFLPLSGTGGYVSTLAGKPPDSCRVQIVTQWRSWGPST
jgi:hypothetical protein